MDSNRLYVDELDELQMVKCVVVGDTGVGKTRLICARACGTRYSLLQLMQTHTPTVWAIDQYRKNRQALNKSWCFVDGVNVSLRLWDTFGDHNKDRRFAYGRADVILVCFSIAHPRSLRNVQQHWYPEIQRLCPNVPIVLCGCQVDLRYLYKDPAYINHDKGPFFREIHDEDILLPEAGRMMAKIIGACYYETSVLEPFGIEPIFMNVARAALIYKRNRHFWTALGTLKRVSRPIWQEPHLSPKPQPPELKLPEVETNTDFSWLLMDQLFCDVVFVVQGIAIKAHKVCLAVASPIFERFFLNSSNLIKPSSDNSKKIFEPDVRIVEISNDTTKLLDSDDSKSSHMDSNSETSLEVSLPSSSLCSPIFFHADPSRGYQMSEGDNPMTVVMVDDSVMPAVFLAVLNYLYSGKCPIDKSLLIDVRWLADSIGLRDLVYAVNNILENEEILNWELSKQFQVQRCHRMKELVLNRGLFSDVVFKLDDGVIKAHKALLAMNCDVMSSMFTSNFMERSSKLIVFPGVSREAFVVLQEFLYTGQCLDLLNINCFELIELANRLCLSRLLLIAEQFIVRELANAEKNGQDITEEVLALLQPAQLHNASFLSKWCLWYLSVNYSSTYKRYSKTLHKLRPENQIYLTNHRWPPLWYFKEHELYEKNLVDLQRERSGRSYFRRNSCGCLSFCGKRNR